jgi:nicotinate dehydrogenase subunit B
LALNTNLHDKTPNNLIRAILDGIPSYATPTIADMPAFRTSLDDKQLTSLVTYLRARFAPNQPPWQNIESSIACIRNNTLSH